MDYKFDIYGVSRNVISILVIILGIFSGSWEFVIAYLLYNIGVSLTDIGVNLKKRSDK